MSLLSLRWKAVFPSFHVAPQGKLKTPFFMITPLHMRTPEATGKFLPVNISGGS